MEIIIKLSTIPLVLLSLLLFISFVVLFWFALKTLHLIWKHFFAYYFGSGVQWKGGPNTWAVVTGATDGIGLSYAKAMAQKGYSLVLMSRSSDKLTKVKNEIHKQFPICDKIITITVDFTEADIYDKIKEQLKQLDEIHVLINNVGITYAHPEYFTEIENQSQFITNIFNVNCNAMTRLMAIVLPQMVDRKSGIVLNVCSLSACFPTPLLALYSASKVFGDYLSCALSTEYEHKGVVIQSVLPYYVSTNMIRNPKSTFMIPTSDRFVRSALTTVGIECRTYGYLPHIIFAFITNYLLKFLIGNNLNSRIAFRRLNAFRERYHLKQEKYAIDAQKTVFSIKL